MNLQLQQYIPWTRSQPNRDISSPLSSSGIVLEEPKQKATVDAKFSQWSPLSLIPWVIRARDKFQLPTTVNKKLKKHSRRRGNVESAAPYSTIRFKPYVSKVPWHTGPRGFLSQLFPRYGHYCGPNWSSGKDRGSLIWDKRPIDWLDFCCYCHDMGYDTHDQSELLKADLAFLECLEKPNMSTKGDPRIAHLYKFMCISGLRNILIPYRQNLVSLQSGKIFYPFGWLSSMKWKAPTFAKPQSSLGHPAPVTTNTIWLDLCMLLIVAVILVVICILSLNVVIEIIMPSSSSCLGKLLTAGTLMISQFLAKYSMIKYIRAILQPVILHMIASSWSLSLLSVGSATSTISFTFPGSIYCRNHPHFDERIKITLREYY